MFSVGVLAAVALRPAYGAAQPAPTTVVRAKGSASASEKPGAMTAHKVIPFGVSQTHGTFEIKVESVRTQTWPIEADYRGETSMKGLIVFVRCMNVGTNRQTLDIPLESLTILKTDGTTADHKSVNTLDFENLLLRNGSFYRQLRFTTADGKQVSRWSFAASTQDADSGKYFGFLDASAMWGGSWSITLDSMKALVVPLLFPADTGNVKELRWPDVTSFSLPAGLDASVRVTPN
jgi:hypothetical protein